MSKLNIDMIREIKNNHPAVPEPFLNESKLLDVEEDCRKAFLSSRTGRLGAFGRAFHSFIEAPSGDLVSAYILAIDSEDERKADVLLRFYTAPGERAVLLYRDTIAFVSETMPEPGDTVTVKSSREFSKDVMLNHGLKWAFERIYPDVNQAALCRPDIYRKEALRIPQEGSKAG